MREHGRIESCEGATAELLMTHVKLQRREIPCSIGGELCGNFRFNSLAAEIINFPSSWTKQDL